ncbi:hypothetical protein, conserved [Trypanosoma brucei gambiense DAL972]|uniref:FHA domain-containing protein n=1 Tax=Trypanosoma brucei gambiense (strain MHOM/CI/86/DAL972) TaxID=679716 RepID=C9ZU01_TRYB9|nr:hypothetical protein, conserved [Trypanosoma brucei gambiense DAL972]CBH12887.1 hypothetical protein, conserved [Trypanosoma brucei gambiense DAL972]|eukprot:XP_011775166.1 hypothetical protein, conserved [Trypanosoma brucei gambiense DAL972]
MFSVEFVSGRPPMSAPYYAIVVREPYVVGRASLCDIVLNQPDIAAQHVSLSVMRRSNAKKLIEKQSKDDANVSICERSFPDLINGDDCGASGDSAIMKACNMGSLDSVVDGSFLNDTNNCCEGRETQSSCCGHNALTHDHGEKKSTDTKVVKERNPLVVLVRRLPDGGRVAVGDTEVTDTQPHLVMDGGQLSLGDRVRLRFRFRPLVVTVSRSSLSGRQACDLECACYRRGATVVPGLTPTRELDVPLPVGLLHCTSALTHDDPACIAALACGYTVVEPGYIPKWFATLARNAASPLAATPLPACSGVPILHGDDCSSEAEYLRPECDESPFPLYPISSPARLSRSRSALFVGRIFFFLTSAVENRYRAAVVTCGGKVQQMEEVVFAVAALCADMDGRWITNNQQHDAHLELASLKGACYYAVLDRDTELAWQNGDSPAQSALRNLYSEAQRVGSKVTLLAERSLFQSLLTNRFTVIEIDLLSFKEGHRDGRESSRGGATLNGRKNPLGEAPLEAAEDIFSYQSAPDRWNVSALLEVLKKKQPEDTLYTPRRRRRNFSSAGRASISPRGENDISSVVSDCDLLCQRVRELVRKEQPKLLEIQAASRRNFFVDPGVSAQVQECRTKCLRYIGKAEDLLSHDLRNPSIKSDLEGCISNCREVLGVVKAIVDITSSGVQGKRESRNRSRSSTSGENHSQVTVSSASSRMHTLGQVPPSTAAPARTGTGSSEVARGTSQRCSPFREVQTSPKLTAPSLGVGGTKGAARGRPGKRRHRRTTAQSPNAKPTETEVAAVEPPGLCVGALRSPGGSPAPRGSTLSRSTGEIHEPGAMRRELQSSKGMPSTSRSHTGLGPITKATSVDSHSHAVGRTSSSSLWPSAPRIVSSPRVSRVAHRRQKVK